MKYLIGIDVGTSALKAVLYDEDGKEIASSSHGYPMEQPQNGWAQQNPEDWKQALLLSLKDITNNLAKNDIVHGIGLTGQMHGLVMLDQDDQIIRPSIIWCDQRTKQEVLDMERLMPRSRWIEISGNPPLTGWTAAKLLWIRKHERQHYERCAHILLPKDYIRFVLTGDYASDVSDASGMQLMDIQHRCWSDEILAKLDIKKSLLPRLYESCEVTGHLLPEIAKALGLSQDTVVVAGAGDNAAAAIGSGVVMDGNAFTTIGTSGVVFAHSSKMVHDPKGRIHTCCAALPQTWHVMGVTQAAGLSLQWFTDTFCQSEKEEARSKQIDVYDVINEKVKDIQPGSDHLLYLPYLMGERTPHLDPDCRGVFFGMSAIHTRAHFLRAVMEGVAYSLADCHDILKELNIDVQEMVVCGGGAKSSIWQQMLSDLYQCQTITLQQNEGPSLGAAILAGVGSGMFQDITTACQRMIQKDEARNPIASNVQLYQQYHALYQKLYHQLKESFHELSMITESFDKKERISS